jgi:hypothetical protein
MVYRSCWKRYIQGSGACVWKISKAISTHCYSQIKVPNVDLVWTVKRPEGYHSFCVGHSLVWAFCNLTTSCYENRFFLNPRTEMTTRGSLFNSCRALLETSLQLLESGPCSPLYAVWWLWLWNCDIFCSIRVPVVLWALERSRCDKTLSSRLWSCLLSILFIHSTPSPSLPQTNLKNEAMVLPCFTMRKVGYINNTYSISWLSPTTSLISPRKWQRRAIVISQVGNWVSRVHTRTTSATVAVVWCQRGVLFEVHNGSRAVQESAVYSMKISNP